MKTYISNLYIAVSLHLLKHHLLIDLYTAVLGEASILQLWLFCWKCTFWNRKIPWPKQRWY